MIRGSAVCVMSKSCMLLSKLKLHIEANYPNMACKFRDHYNRKIKELKIQKGTFLKQK